MDNELLEEIRKSLREEIETYERVGGHFLQRAIGMEKALNIVERIVRNYEVEKKAINDLVEKAFNE